MTAGQQVIAGSAGVKPLAGATAAPTPVQQSAGNGGGTTASTATTTAVSVTVSGGKAPYTYQWAIRSGVNATINTPTAASTTFTRTASAPATAGTYTELNGQFYCTVTDAKGAAVQTNDVAVITRHWNGPVGD